MAGVASPFPDIIKGGDHITIAVIAHDNKKSDMVSLVKEHEHILKHDRIKLIGTGTTGGKVEESIGVKVERMCSGPLGGDAQIASRIVEGKVHAVIFIVDPLFAHPHEPDIQGLLRVINLKNIPYATNIATAKILLQHIHSFLAHH